MDCRSLMRRSARYFAEKTAIVHGERRLSFAAAWTRGLRLANALLALGYSDKEAVAAVKKVPEGLAVGDAIRQALKLLAKV